MTASPDDVLAMVYFARVVQARSFTAAAAKLGVSKSVVSARVAALEARLGVRLLQRTTRRLSLTPEGLSLYDRCARVVAAADEAAAEAAGAGQAPRGVLRVNAPSTFAPEYLPGPMAAYLRRFPDMRIELSLSDRVVDLVEEGIDVAVRISARLRESSLVVRKLAADRTVVCASPAYLAERGTPQSPQELVHHDCLRYAELRAEDEWRFRGGGKSFAVPVAGKLSSASGAFLREAAVAGLGLAVLPTFMAARALAAGRLVAVLERWCFVQLGVYAVYPQARAVPSKTRAFVDLLVAHFRAPPWAQRGRPEGGSDVGPGAGPGARS
jgi:DNA-binding transcriptional LysR family regulator